MIAYLYYWKLKLTANFYIHCSVRAQITAVPKQQFLKIDKITQHFVLNRKSLPLFTDNPGHNSCSNQLYNRNQSQWKSSLQKSQLIAAKLISDQFSQQVKKTYKNHKMEFNFKSTLRHILPNRFWGPVIHINHRLSYTSFK